jgi:hypothetical protein
MRKGVSAREKVEKVSGAVNFDFRLETVVGTVPDTFSDTFSLSKRVKR